MYDTEPIIFALNSSRDYGMRVAKALNLSLSTHEEREFEDGEHKIRPLTNVRQRNVFVIQSLYGDSQSSVNDKLCRLLFMLGTLRDASALSVTAVLPYLCYARKDRKTKTRDPVTTRYVAQLFEAIGVDHLVTLDVHNLAAYQNAFHRTTTDHLDALKLFVEHFAAQLPSRDLVVVSPDVGGVKRAELFREALERRTGLAIGSAFQQKARSEGVVRAGGLVGDVRGRAAIIIDDLISSGTTLALAAQACRAAGALQLHAAATHAMFSSKTEEILGSAALDQLVVTDTVPAGRYTTGLVRLPLTVLDTAPLFASAIRCIDDGGSIAELLQV